ncbi:MAG: hypothetical protein ABIJ65_01160 [Chloroflexota bacterium]
MLIVKVLLLHLCQQAACAACADLQPDLFFPGDVTLPGMLS